MPAPLGVFTSSIRRGWEMLVLIMDNFFLVYFVSDDMEK